MIEAGSSNGSSSRRCPRCRRRRRSRSRGRRLSRSRSRGRSRSRINLVLLLLLVVVVVASRGLIFEGGVLVLLSTSFNISSTVTQ